MLGFSSIHSCCADCLWWDLGALLDTCPVPLDVIEFTATFLVFPITESGVSRSDALLVSRRRSQTGHEMYPSIEQVEHRWRDRDARGKVPARYEDADDPHILSTRGRQQRKWAATAATFDYVDCVWQSDTTTAALHAGSLPALSLSHLDCHRPEECLLLMQAVQWHAAVSLCKQYRLLVDNISLSQFITWLACETTGSTTATGIDSVYREESER